MNETEKRKKTPVSKKVLIILCFALAWLMSIPLAMTDEQSMLHIVSLFADGLFVTLGINLWFFLKKRSRTSLFLLLLYDFLVLFAMIGYMIAKLVIISATQNPG